VKLIQRYYLFGFVLLSMSSYLNSMIMDNRYFPWMPHLYNGTDHRHGCLYVEPFFITAASASKIKPGVRAEDQEYGFPNLLGTQSTDTQNPQSSLNYTELASALTTLGLENPIPADWQYIQNFAVDMQGSFQGQGLSVAGYIPFTNHIGMGGSMLFMNLTTQANLTPSKTVQGMINYNAAGNQAKFADLTESFESLVNTKEGFLKKFGTGDIEIYLRGYDVQDYIYFCRKVDRSICLGLFIPTGLESTIHNIASVPFGGNGFWGWYVAPELEIELKEDWKVGFDIRLEKRFAKTIKSRIPIINEAPLFAPLIGDVKVNPGITFCVAPYFALQHIREGLAAMIKYTYVLHAKDQFTDTRTTQTPEANFTNMIADSKWIQEYIALEFLYDLSFKQSWEYTPLFTLSIDVPLTLAGARGSSQTYRISLGATVDF